MSALADPFTPEEKTLAREALGFFGDRAASSQNHYMARPGKPDHHAWLSLVERHLARRFPSSWGVMDVFILTRAGAERALEPGETLDPKDFPTIGQD